MSLRLYMDVNVPYSITAQLRLRGVNVLTAGRRDKRAGRLEAS